MFLIFAYSQKHETSQFICRIIFNDGDNQEFSVPVFPFVFHAFILLPKENLHVEWHYWFRETSITRKPTRPKYWNSLSFNIKSSYIILAVELSECSAHTPSALCQFYFVSLHHHHLHSRSQPYAILFYSFIAYRTTVYPFPFFIKILAENNVTKYFTFFTCKICLILCTATAGNTKQRKNIKNWENRMSLSFLFSLRACLKFCSVCWLLVCSVENRCS